MLPFCTVLPMKLEPVRVPEAKRPLATPLIVFAAAGVPPPMLMPVASDRKTPKLPLPEIEFPVTRELAHWLLT